MKIHPNASKESLQQAANDLDGVIHAMLHPKRDRVSAAKIAANRRNALQSTGPKTDAGKLASSRNAVKHGLYSSTFLLPEEVRSEYEAFCDRYLDELQPEGLAEENLVREMIAAQWRLLRLNLVEQGVWATPRCYLKADQPAPATRPNAIEIAFEAGQSPNCLKNLAAISQLQSRLAREYHRAANQLHKLQEERKPVESASEQPEPLAAEDSLNSSTPSTSSTSFCETNPTPPANAGIDPLKSAVENGAEASGRDGLPDDHAYRE